MNKDRTFKIGEVQFNLAKIPPLEAWDLCELIREAVGQPEVLFAAVPDSLPSQNDKEGIKKIAMRAMTVLFAGVKREHVKQLKDEFFKYVKFKAPGQPKEMDLSGLEEMAFETLDPFAIYEIIGRCFLVNFPEYFNEMLSRFGINVSALKADLNTSQ